MKYILLDLDGTLLPMEQDQFTKAYFKALTVRMAPFRHADELIQSIWTGTEAMIRNDGSKKNEQAFWDTYVKIFGDSAREDEPHFWDFYQNHFPKVKSACGFTPKAKELIQKVKSHGLQPVLASNPLFPLIAQRERMTWAGVDPDDFIHITSYENSSYCKPNPRYYQEILEHIGAKPEECLMIGNDAHEDMAASKLGIHVFLLTECLINKNTIDVTQFPAGNYQDLFRYLDLRHRMKN
ncbi:MAG: HAD family hydrolase [Bacillota bacterium]|nr:HAD family hydrolase [Bacillota bacterium]